MKCWDGLIPTALLTLRASFFLPHSGHNIPAPRVMKVKQKKIYSSLYFLFFGAFRIGIEFMPACRYMRTSLFFGQRQRCFTIILISKMTIKIELQKEAIRIDGNFNKQVQECRLISINPDKYTHSCVNAFVQCTCTLYIPECDRGTQA